MMAGPPVEPLFLTLLSSRADTVREVSRAHMSTGLLDELALGRLGSVRRGYALGAGLLVIVAVAIGATRMGRGTLSSAVTDLARAQPGWLVVAAASFAGALLASAAAWRAGLRACGGSACFTQVSARYAIGSLVNALAPAHLGGAVRLALLSRTLPGHDRLWRAGGVGASVGAARTLALAALVAAAAGVGRIPFWPAPILAAGALCTLLLCRRLSHRAAGRLGSLLEIFRSVGQTRRAGASLCAWVGLSLAARLGAATAIAMALDAPRPIWVAVVLVAAMALAGMLPLTPGNFGAGAGAATLALHGTGVGLGVSLALGVAFQAVETFAGMTLGVVGAAVLAAPGTAVRRWSFAAAGAAAVLVAAALGVATVDLV